MKKRILSRRDFVRIGAVPGLVPSRAAIDRGCNLIHGSNTYGNGVISMKTMQGVPKKNAEACAEFMDKALPIRQLSRAALSMWG